MSSGSVTVRTNSQNQPEVTIEQTDIVGDQLEKQIKQEPGVVDDVFEKPKENSGEIFV